jgi:quercetin dioxygenase-like cupin family protein
MGFRRLAASDAHWRPSNQMSVLNTDLAKQLGATTLSARLWRLMSGQASKRHRHFDQSEMYLLLEGTGRMRVDDEVLTLAPLDSILVEPESVRQLFNDTADEQLWLVAGAPPEPANTLEMTDEQLRFMYPDGPKALPPELSVASEAEEAEQAREGVG